MFKKVKICPYLLISVLAVGCFFKREVSEILERSGYFYIVPKPAYIDDPSIIDWTVGPLGKTVLSKGFSFKIHLPYVPPSALRKLIDDHKIDSWIINIRKKSSGSDKSLRYFYTPIINNASLAIGGSSASKTYQKKQFTVHIFYADAAISERFASLSCPALRHNLVLNNIELLKRKSFNRFVTVQSKIGSPFNQKVLQYNIAGNKINGGKSLTGEYSVHLAFYSFKKKRIFSNFYDLKNVIKVSGERPKVVKGCLNFRVPSRDEESPGTFPFKSFKK